MRKSTRFMGKPFILWQLALFFCGLLLLNGCSFKYSFSGTSVDPKVKTLSVETFENIASLVEPTLSQTLTEKMKDRLSSEARLDVVALDGDAEFSGTILNYIVEPAASGADDKAEQNRLSITISVEYLNKITDENWTQTFKHFENFDRNANLSDVQSTLIDEITDKLVSDVFNKAFTNW